MHNRAHLSPALFSAILHLEATPAHSSGTHSDVCCRVSGRQQQPQKDPLSCCFLSPRTFLFAFSGVIREKLNRRTATSHRQDEEEAATRRMASTEAPPAPAASPTLQTLQEVAQAMELLEAHYPPLVHSPPSRGPLQIRTRDQPIWEGLIAPLRRLVDLTHPDLATTTAADTSAAGTDALPSALVSAHPSTLHLFHFLCRVATVAELSAEEGDATGAHHAAVHRTKAELLADDTLEAVLLYGCAIASNVAATSVDGVAKLSRRELEQSMWDAVLAVARLYAGEKRVLHFLLSVLSNLATRPSLEVSTEACGLLYRLVVPFYTSEAVVGVWMAMLCNLVAVHDAATVPTLLGLGLVADVQRLALATSPTESATSERLVLHAVQLLSNVSVFVFQEP